MIDEYTPFEGICLTDTFQMYEKDDLVAALLRTTAPVVNGRRELGPGSGFSGGHGQTRKMRRTAKRAGRWWSGRS